MWKDRILWRYLDADDGGGGGEPAPAEPTPAEPKPAEPDDSGLEAGRQAYVSRLKELGGQFDTAGNFLGFAAPEPPRQQTPQNYQTPDPYNAPADDDLDTKLNSMKDAIVAEIMPEKVEGGFGRVLNSHPELKRYEKEARSAIDSMGSASVNDQTILSMLYFIRGQAADVEIAEATAAARTKATTKVEGGSVVAGSQDGNTPPPTNTVNNGQIDPLVSDLATGWGLDPAKMQEKLNAQRKGAK